MRAGSAVLLLLVLLFPASPALADDTGWAVQPAGGTAGRSHFVYDLVPGQVVDDVVRVSNRSSSAQTFTVYATDAYTTVDGAFDLLPASRRPTDVGAWIAFGQRAYTVEGGASLDIPFRLTVPTNAAPGDHAGGVLASLVTTRTGGDGQRVNVDRRIAARVYLRVAGDPRPALKVEGMRVSYDNPPHPFSGGTMTVTYDLRNTGNLRLSGVARVRLTGPFGVGLGATRDIAVPELLPGARITVTETVRGIAPAGYVTAAATVVARDVPVTTSKTSLWAVPWTVLGVAVLLLAWGWRSSILQLWWWLIGGKRRKSGATSARSPKNPAGSARERAV
ncbi:hypothetical protein Val02_58440 [Virgisporangium aliadipatigenens]|uniref:DUF916 domain-containing protein n=1 Tax=Virgisporangium aliadipatigenens TaxID=741659 RepID=A0A8J4DTG5_9ACTN|nr:DUF916 domain-containing protein [Virgisporangium aliadipatigenens]GIJ48958.1 hypothetical protein Val02_58440 [Virgisporangium aliadipatigenens]